MRKLLLIMVSLFALGLIATACGGDDPTSAPITPSVTAQDIQEAVDRAIAGAAAGQTTPDEIQKLIEAAITTAAAGTSEGLTADQVGAIVAAAASPEGLSASEVEGIVSAALAAQASMEMAPTGPFVIGVMESLTGPGETYGNVAVQAKLLAVQEINAAGGIDGRPLKLIIEDSKCNARDSITAYTKLTSVDGVKIILGTSCSGEMLGAAPLAEKDGVIMFYGLATNPLIADAGDYIFRTAINDKLVGVDTGNTIWADGIRKLGTITEATDYAEGVRRETAKQFEALGGEIVAAEAYASEETDYRAAIRRTLRSEERREGKEWKSRWAA